MPDYSGRMVKSILYDPLGYVVGEPDVPDPPPHIVIWGNEAFLAGCPTEEGRPQYYSCSHYVVPETRETPRLS